MLGPLELPACGPVNIRHCSMSQSVPGMLHPLEQPAHGAVNFMRSTMPQSVPMMLRPLQLPAHGPANFLRYSMPQSFPRMVQWYCLWIASASLNDPNKLPGSLSGLWWHCYLVLLLLPHPYWVSVTFSRKCFTERSYIPRQPCHRQREPFNVLQSVVKRVLLLGQTQYCSKRQTTSYRQ